MLVKELKHGWNRGGEGKVTSSSTEILESHSDLERSHDRDEG